jgi:glyoxylate/hydroxypyruvate reductase A
VHSLPNVQCFAGRDSLPQFLHKLDILVCLLPLTKETFGILNAELFGQMKPGAKLLHCGRGAHLNHEDLLTALDSSHLGGAMLDVTQPEPLPKGDPLWSHPKVILTPHIATETDAEEGASCAIRIIRAFEARQSFAEEVDRSRGY